MRVKIAIPGINLVVLRAHEARAKPCGNVALRTLAKADHNGPEHFGLGPPG